MNRPATESHLRIHLVGVVLVLSIWALMLSAQLKENRRLMLDIHSVSTGDSLTQEDQPTEPSKLESAELRNLVEQTNADNRELIYQWFQMHTRLEEVENELEGLGQGNERADRPDRKVKDSGN